MDLQRLRSDLQQGESDDLRRRRAIIGLSLVGMTAVGAVTLLWCPYCITAAFANWGILALTLPEARKALAAVQEERAPVSDSAP